MKWINRLYIFFLGIILTITTGFGVAAFYPQPTAPVFMNSRVTPPLPESCNATPQAQKTKECQAVFQAQNDAMAAQNAQQMEYEKNLENFRNVSAGYTRTAVFLGIVIGTIFALLGIIFIRNSRTVATGLLLGGVLTAILTRLLINLASLGATVNGSARADNLAFIEFGVLLILSILVVAAGQFRLIDLDKD